MCFGLGVELSDMQVLDPLVLAVLLTMGILQVFLQERKMALTMRWPQSSGASVQVSTEVNPTTMETI